MHQRRVLTLAIACATTILLSARAGAQALPGGWTHQDIGAVGRAGTATYDSGTSTFTVTGAGADVWGTADALQYADQTLSGDGSIVARVASIQNTAPWTKAGVMMRDTLNASSAQAFMLISSGKGAAFQRRDLTRGVSASTAGALVAAPYWVRLDRVGNTFTAYQSPDGSAWTLVGSDSIPMGANIFVGLGVSSHTATATATATFDHVTVVAAAPSTGHETIVVFRHAEKPAGGFGQLTCQGLNRSLALASVLIARYGTPAGMFAPDPGVPIVDPAGTFNYVRPLATIEPTAIGLGLPVNTAYGYTDVNGLQATLLGTAYTNATVFVAWEHVGIQQLAQNIVNLYGDGAAVPAFASGDFDSIYVLQLTRSGGAITAQFEHDFEGLNGQSTSCPF